MPNEEEKKEQEIKGLSPKDISSQVSKAINDNLDKREQAKAIQDYIMKKGQNLSEEGMTQYMGYLERVPLQEDKTPQQVIDSQDNYLKYLEQQFPKEGNETEEEPEQEANETKETKKKEPVNKSKKIEVEEDNDPNKLTEEEELYSTPEGYVKEHNKRYNLMKRVNRFSTQLSVNS